MPLSTNAPFASACTWTSSDPTTVGVNPGAGASTTAMALKTNSYAWVWVTLKCPVGAANSTTYAYNCLEMGVTTPKGSLWLGRGFSGIVQWEQVSVVLTPLMRLQSTAPGITSHTQYPRVTRNGRVRFSFAAFHSGTHLGNQAFVIALPKPGSVEQD